MTEWDNARLDEWFDSLDRATPEIDDQFNPVYVEGTWSLDSEFGVSVNDVSFQATRDGDKIYLVSRFNESRTRIAIGLSRADLDKLTKGNDDENDS